jgi:hypothetical protein
MNFFHHHRLRVPFDKLRDRAASGGHQGHWIARSVPGNDNMKG